jgi:arabinofuranosyltransferase
MAKTSARRRTAANTPVATSPLRRVDKPLALVVLLAALGLYVGWDALWFLCDDAFIAFRYVAHGVSGLGYTWNPPPFRPVEGYTSFLWVALLEAVWRVTGAPPPASANVLALACAWGTLALTAAMALRLRLSSALARHRTLVVALVLAGTVANRTFLAWSSSGLETALFGLLVTAWLWLAGFADATRAAWPALLSAIAALAALARPDGLLFVALTPALVALRGRLRREPRALAGLAPLGVVIVHLAWRHARYGAWLPNTYFAKSTGAWPEAGARYLASFVLEYGLVTWIVLLALVVSRRASGLDADADEPSADERGRRRALGLAMATLVAHAGYYTLVVGGDHFEYRVYAHLVPLVFLSGAWAVGRLPLEAGPALGALAGVVALSLPIPWTHWAITHDLRDRASTLRLRAPVAPHLPEPVAWYGRLFDEQQAWLVERFVGMRHQEHKVLWQSEMAAMPAVDDAVGEGPDGVPVLAAEIVGVAGWAFPRVAIVDELGLNDAVVARAPVADGPVRRMAHERRPPAGYVECFAPNVALKNGKAIVRPRAEPLTADRIVACEREFGQKVGL